MQSGPWSSLGCHGCYVFSIAASIFNLAVKLGKITCWLVKIRPSITSPLKKGKRTQINNCKPVCPAPPFQIWCSWLEWVTWVTRYRTDKFKVGTRTDGRKETHIDKRRQQHPKAKRGLKNVVIKLWHRARCILLTTNSNSLHSNRKLKLTYTIKSNINMITARSSILCFVNSQHIDA